MKPCGVYCRVSTEDQAVAGTSLESQLEACLKYCCDKGYEAAYRFEESYSVLELDRPQLNELRELARAGNIDVIVVYCLDRLSRNATHGVILRDEFDKYNVVLESVTEDIDKSPLGEAITYLRGTFAQIEAEKIRERTMRGKRAKLIRGELPQGTGVGMYGYTWNSEKKRREIDNIEADIVRSVFIRVASGDSLISIARGLNEQRIPTKSTKSGDEKRKFWHSLTIRRMIRNSGYIGITRFGDTVLTDITPAIVSKDIFDAANAQLDKPKVRTGRPKHEYLPRNHTFCGLCGKPLVGHFLNKKYRYYQCSNARPYDNSGKKCPALFIRANELEEMVWSRTREVLANPDVILRDLAQQGDRTNLDSIDAEIKATEKILQNYVKRRSNLLEAMELGEFSKDEILDRLNNIKRLRREDEGKLNDLLKTREHLMSLANAEVKLNELYVRVLDNIEHSTPEIKALALDALDIKVYASTERVEIRGVIPLAMPTTAQTSA
ncbi:recombinase family protein [Chloroflexota bacterium]